AIPFSEAANTSNETRQNTKLITIIPLYLEMCSYNFNPGRNEAAKEKGSHIETPDEPSEVTATKSKAFTNFTDIQDILLDSLLDTL
ncbi:hypothetical protein V1477_008030, partial [Vespula maculifrons]